MRFSHSRVQLLTACTVADSAVANRTTKPILTCIKIVAGERKIVAMGTDNEIGVRYEMPAEDIEADGVCVLPPERLLPILKQAGTSPIQFRENGDTVQVKTASGRFELRGQNATEFPDVPPLTGDDGTCEVNRVALADAIARTLPAADRTEATARWAVTGLLFEVGKKELLIAGTDTRRLAVATMKAERLSEPVTGLIPRKACEVLIRALATSDAETVTFALTANGATFACGPVTVHTKLVEGRFPPYRDIIPKKPTHKFGVPRVTFADAVSQAAIMKEVDTCRVDLKFANGSVEMASQSLLGASDVKLELPEYGAGVIEMGFNPQYLADCFRVCAGETLDVEMTDGGKPVVFRDGADYLHLIMPLTG